MVAREKAESGRRKSKKSQKPRIAKSKHLQDIETMLLVSNQYRMMSRYIEHKFGERYSQWALKRYRESHLRERVVEYEKKRAELEKSTDAKDKKIRQVAALGESLLGEAQKRKRDTLAEMNKHLQSTVTVIEKGKAVEKKIAALTQDLQTGFDQYRDRLKESTMSPLEVYLYLQNCGLLVVENKMSLMMKMPMAMGSVMNDLKVAADLVEKVRDEMISLGQHPPMQPSGPQGGNIFVGNNQVVGQMNVGQGRYQEMEDMPLTPEAAHAELLYLSALSRQQREYQKRLARGEQIGGE
jgi:hypothetical protein